jgi:methanogenic corrinoid protein MtbC1
MIVLIFNKGKGMNKEELYKKMKIAIIEGNKQAVESLARESIAQGLAPDEVIEKSFIKREKDNAA